MPAFASPGRAGSEPTESLTVAAILTACGGFLDAFTYIGHGHVFANSMTGNVVLLGLALGAGDGLQVWRHVLPIAAFLVGVLAAHLIRLGGAPRRAGWAERVSLWIEIGFLGLVALLPRHFPDQVIILGIAFVAAVQSTSFTRVRGDGYNSTMTTGNLRRFAEALYAGVLPRLDRHALGQARTLAVICLCFLAGAVGGGVATPRFSNAALLAPIVGLAAALALSRRGATGAAQAAQAVAATD